MENDGLSKLIKQNHKEACVYINMKKKKKSVRNQIQYHICVISDIQIDGFVYLT